MDQQNPREYLIAQEWVRLRQKLQTERDPDKLLSLIAKLKVLLREAEQLTGFDDEGAWQEAASDIARDHSPNQKSGASE